ncbi:MAG TPA: hypothetical protein VG815_07770 [Chloroflexota bacterium]|nr:hypothetical protein [Chloroflexota bacterium]
MADVINGDPDLIALGNRTLVYPGGAGRISGTDLMFRLIRLARRASVPDAMADLATLLEASQLTAYLNLGVAGVEIETARALGGGIEVLPFSALSEIDSTLVSLKGYRIPDFGFDSPTAVFRKALRIPAIWRTGDSETPLAADIPKADFSPLLTAMNCVTIAGPSAPYVVAQWLSFDLRLLTAGFGHGGTTETRRAEVTLSDAQWEDARTLHEEWSKLPLRWPDVLEVSVQRLNSAMRRRSPVDRAIDLGIAFESLFSEEGDPTSELTFRISSRAAFLLGATIAERKAVAKLFKTLYGLRSTAVHEGRFPRTKRKGRISEQDVFPILEEGFRVVAQALRTVIQRGGVHWDDVMFGDSSPPA